MEMAYKVYFYRHGQNVSDFNLSTDVTMALTQEAMTNLENYEFFGEYARSVN